MISKKIRKRIENGRGIPNNNSLINFASRDPHSARSSLSCPPFSPSYFLPPVVSLLPPPACALHSSPHVLPAVCLFFLTLLPLVPSLSPSYFLPLVCSLFLKPPAPCFPLFLSLSLPSSRPLHSFPTCYPSLFPRIDLFPPSIPSSPLLPYRTLCPCDLSFTSPLHLSTPRRPSHPVNPISLAHLRPPAGPRSLPNHVDREDKVINPLHPPPTAAADPARSTHSLFPNSLCEVVSHATPKIDRQSYPQPETCEDVTFLLSLRVVGVLACVCL